MYAAHAGTLPAHDQSSFFSRINGPGHERALQLFMAIVLAHWAEHLLQAQFLIGQNLLDRPVPTSIVQLWVPRVELHLFYNTVVFIPMVIAMYHHMFPPPSVAGQQKCSCAWHRGLAPAV
jgi:hypothetical protein